MKLYLNFIFVGATEKNTSKKSPIHLSSESIVALNFSKRVLKYPRSFRICCMYLFMLIVEIKTSVGYLTLYSFRAQFAYTYITGRVRSHVSKVHEFKHHRKSRLLSVLCTFLLGRTKYKIQSCTRFVHPSI